MNGNENKGNNGKWRCPACKVEADVEGRNLHIRVVGVMGYRWPLHDDCELAKDIDHIDFSKLEKVS